MPLCWNRFSLVKCKLQMCHRSGAAAMEKTTITIGIAAEPRTKGIIDGKIEVEGSRIKVIHHSLSPGEQHHRFEQNEFDVCEFSTATFLRTHEVSRRFLALPVFFTRGLR